MYFDQVFVSNLTLKKRKEIIRNRINYLFQNYALIEDWTVMDNLLLAMYYTKLKKRRKRTRLIKLCQS